jgi:hypothetical protein
MIKEHILDIGIGAGGSYILKNTAPYEQRIGIDIDRWTMPNLHTNYPEVFPVLATSEHIPFRVNTFSRIEIILPLGELMVPGLQNDHFALNEEYRVLYAQTYPNGWYKEFQRVLKPHGELIIFGDIWIDPIQVHNTSKLFFNIESVKKLSETEFNTLGTSTVPIVIRNIHRNPFIDIIDKNSCDLLVKIILRSNKSY